MPFGIGRGNDHKNDEFVPTEEERGFLEPFLENRDTPFLVVKKQILESEFIPLTRREKLGEWFRDARAKVPSTSERINF